MSSAFLESLASTAAKKAEKAGASQVEAFVIGAHGRSVYIENSKPRLSEDKLEIGLGLKVALGKHVGFSSGTINKKDASDDIVDEALSIARTTSEDPHFVSLPAGRNISGQVKASYSEETCKIGIEEIIKKATTAVETAEKTGKVKVPLGLIRLADYSMHVVNSLGVSFSHKGTMVFSYFKSKAASGDRAGEGIEKEWSTNISTIDFERMGRSVAERAVATLNAESFKGESNLVALIDPVELEGLIFVVGFASNSDNVTRKRSPWANRLGTKVADDRFSVWDDGKYAGGIRSAPADDEGVETTKKLIIDRGKLQSFIFDSYNANISGTKSTGNGFRRGTRSIEGAFISPTVCSYANMVVKPGNQNLDEIVSKIDKGVLIEAFAAPEVNEITGAFGCEVRNATLIEDGQLTKHVKHALLTGNMYEALKNVVAAGKETKLVENTVLPHLAFSNVMLVGQT